VCEQKLHQWQNAHASYLKALEIKPSDYWTLKQLAILSENQCLYQDAIVFYSQLEQIEEDPQDIYYKLAQYHLIVGNRDQAHHYQQLYSGRT